MSESPEPAPGIFTQQKERATRGYAEAATLAAMKVFLPSIISMQPTERQAKEQSLRSMGLRLAGVSELGAVVAVSGATLAVTGSVESAALMAAVTYPVAKAATLSYEFVSMHLGHLSKEVWEEGKKKLGIKNAKPEGNLLHDVERSSDLTRVMSKTVGAAVEVLLPGALTARKVEGGELGINRFIQGAGIVSEAAGYAILGTAAVQGRPDLAVAGVAAIVGGKVATLGAEVAEHIHRKYGGFAEIPIKAIESVAGTAEKIADYRDAKVKELKDLSSNWQKRMSLASGRLKTAGVRLGFK